jgi:hypothetical protein
MHAHLFLKTVKNAQMKKNLSLFIAAVLITTAFHAKAQCDLNPEIKPDNLILCPNAKDTLRTAEAYDSYQWFKNNKPIEGATGRFYAVEQYRDAGSYFKVAVTRNGCTDTSKRVLVDGYVFLLPYVITTGDAGIYDPGKDVTFQCPGDKVVLTMGEPYTKNIQWYNAWKPIEGATSRRYTVTEKGSYTVCGSPAICPDYTDCQSIPMNFTFEKVEATITEKNDTLYASKAKNYQWYFNGQPIPGAKDNYLTPNRNGNYKVSINTKYDCTALSAPYYYSGAAPADMVTVSPNPVSTTMHVHIKQKGVSQIVVSDLYGNRFRQIPYRSNDEYINIGDLHTGTYVLQLLNNKQQVLASVKIFKQ